MTQRCQCVSPVCPGRHEGALECSADAVCRVRSRDWDGLTYALCAWCGIAARAGRIFEAAP